MVVAAATEDPIVAAKDRRYGNRSCSIRCRTRRRCSRLLRSLRRAWRLTLPPPAAPESSAATATARNSEFFRGVIDERVRPVTAAGRGQGPDLNQVFQSCRQIVDRIAGRVPGQAGCRVPFVFEQAPAHVVAGDWRVRWRCRPGYFNPRAGRDMRESDVELCEQIARRGGRGPRSPVCMPPSAGRLATGAISATAVDTSEVRIDGEHARRNQRLSSRGGGL